MQEPLVSILIPVYNSEGTIAAAIESCLNQSYGNIEVLVLDDASTDMTSQIIAGFENVKLLMHEKNLGIPNARNALLNASNGAYVAWLDADDTMMPNRIERQVAFMLENPEVDIAGSWVFTDNPLLPAKKLPTDNAVITSYLWFKNCMVQPSIISKNFYKTEQVFYNTAYFFMQDYELWLRLSGKKVFANIPEFLMRYHMSSSAETNAKHMRYTKMQKADQIWKEKWEGTDFKLDETEKKILQDFLSGTDKINLKEAVSLKAIFNKMMANDRFGKVSENELMVHFYRLLIFKRLGFLSRLLNLSLLRSLTQYAILKRKYLVQ